MRSKTFDRLSFWSLFSVIILLPFFFLPFKRIPIETSKGLLLVVGLTLCIIFWAIARFFDGKINLPRSLCLLGGGGVVLATFLSAIFSKTLAASFFGTMFDPGSFWFIFSAFLLMTCSSILFRTSKQAKIVLFGAILSSAVVLIFQTARLFLPEVLSLGVLMGKTDTVLGSLNTLALFAGFSCLMSLLVVEFFSTTKIEKWILGILVVLSMLLVASANFLLAWILLGVSSLIIFVYKVSIISKENQIGSIVIIKERKTYFPAFSFTIIMVTLLFFISGTFIGEILPDRLRLSNNEFSLPFSTTMQVTKSVIKNNPVFGMGPNKFLEAWANYKPAVVNTTIFWDTAFNAGSGLLPTLTSTTGILGILAWITFFVLFIISGVKSIFSSIKNGVNWETMAFFVLSFYLFVSSFFYSTGSVVFFLAFAFAGVFVGLSTSNNPKGEISLSFFNDHRKNFFSMLSIILLVIFSVAASFKYIERLVSESHFRKALVVTDVPEAITSINKALRLYSNDLYLRTYAQLYLVKFDSLIRQTSLSDEEKAGLQVNLDQAVNGAQLATIYNPENYLNFQVLGSVYQGLALFGVKDASSKAIEAYKMALALNPLSPRLHLALAGVLFIDTKVKEARDYANLALSLKPDYVDAFIILSQVAKSEGNNADAISYGEKALALAPTNADLIKFVDSLKNGDTSNTVTPSSATDKKKP